MKVLLLLALLLTFSIQSVAAQANVLDDTKITEEVIGENVAPEAPVSTTENGAKETSDSAEGSMNAEVKAVTNPPTDTEATAANAVVVDNRKESEITLNLDNTKKQAGNDNPLYRFFAGFLVIGILVAGGVFYVRRQTKASPYKSQTQIKVITQHHLGPKKSLAIVRVAGESILIGVTDQNISMIKSLALLDEDIPEETPNSFSRVLGGFSAKDKDFKNDSKKGDDIEAEEEFAIKGIKDVVTRRLKNMRSIE